MFCFECLLEILCLSSDGCVWDISVSVTTTVALGVRTLTVEVIAIIPMMREDGRLATKGKEEEVGVARREETNLSCLSLFLLSTLLTTCLTCLMRSWDLLNRFGGFN